MVMESRTFIKYKAWNNSLPMDNVQLKKKVDQPNPWVARHVIHSYMFS